MVLSQQNAELPTVRHMFGSWHSLSRVHVWPAAIFACCVLGGVVSCEGGGDASVLPGTEVVLVAGCRLVVGKGVSFGVDKSMRVERVETMPVDKASMKLSGKVCQGSLY